MNDDKDLGYIMSLRKVLGNRPIIMAGSSVLILNDKNELLLEKRADDGLWDCPAGSMELAESFEECARREAFEETGLKCGKLEYFTTESGRETFNIYPNGDQTYYAGVIFICRDFEGELKAQEEEVSDLRFFALDKLPEPMSQFKKELFKSLKEHIEKNG